MTPTTCRGRSASTAARRRAPGERRVSVMVRLEAKRARILARISGAVACSEGLRQNTKAQGSRCCLLGYERSQKGNMGPLRHLYDRAPRDLTVKIRLKCAR